MSYSDDKSTPLSGNETLINLQAHQPVIVKSNPHKLNQMKLQKTGINQKKFWICQNHPICNQLHEMNNNTKTKVYHE